MQGIAAIIGPSFWSVGGQVASRYIPTIEILVTLVYNVPSDVLKLAVGVKNLLSKAGRLVLSI